MATQTTPLFKKGDKLRPTEATLKRGVWKATAVVTVVRVESKRGGYRLLVGLPPPKPYVHRSAFYPANYVHTNFAKES